MRMGLCVIHKELIEELRQDIAAAFTCLSGLILRNESGQGAPSVCSPHLTHSLYASSLAVSITSRPFSVLAGFHTAHSAPSGKAHKGGPAQQGVASVTWCSAGADEYAGETMQRLCSAALDFQATMYSLPIRAEYNIHVETLALFSKISTSVARQVATHALK